MRFALLLLLLAPAVHSEDLTVAGLQTSGATCEASTDKIECLQKWATHDYRMVTLDAAGNVLSIIRVQPADPVVWAKLLAQYGTPDSAGKIDGNTVYNWTLKTVTINALLTDTVIFVKNTHIPGA